MLSNIERYSRGLEQCAAKAELAQHIEIRQLWNTIAASYAFLLKREKERDEDERGTQGH